MQTVSTRLPRRIAVDMSAIYDQGQDILMHDSAIKWSVFCVLDNEKDEQGGIVPINK